jgi:hypothetical protein
MRNAILSELVYAFKRGQVSACTSDPKRYRYRIPGDDRPESICIGDVWICDRAGHIDPDLNVSLVPVPREAIGAVVARCYGKNKYDAH